MARTGIVWPFFWTSLALLASGCKGVDLSSVPLADELGFVEVKPVPKEIRTRYGPTSKDRLEDIRKQRNRAKHGSDNCGHEKESLSKTFPGLTPAFQTAHQAQRMAFGTARFKATRVCMRQ